MLSVNKCWSGLELETHFQDVAGFSFFCQLLFLVSILLTRAFLRLYRLQISLGSKVLTLALRFLMLNLTAVLRFFYGRNIVLFSIDYSQFNYTQSNNLPVQQS